jgi:hypothetical protein
VRPFDAIRDLRFCDNAVGRQRTLLARLQQRDKPILRGNLPLVPFPLQHVKTPRIVSRVDPLDRKVSARLRHHAILLTTMVAFGVSTACSDDEGGSGIPAGSGGTAGAAGAAGMSGAAGAGGDAMGGAAGRAGSGGSGGSTPLPPPTPALPDDAPTVACPTQINGSLDVSDSSQTGRHSRIEPVAACGMTKGFPGNAADPTNPHLFDVYRFSNPSAAPVCFNFTLTYGDIGVSDAGADAGSDASIPVDEGNGLDAGADAADSGGEPPVVNAGPARYLTAYGTFFPTDLALEYRGDVGGISLTSPQAMGITVPAGDTIDVVVYAIDVAPAGVGSYTLSCSTL